MLLVDFVLFPIKSKFADFIPPSYSGPDLENTNRNEPEVNLNYHLKKCMRTDSRAPTRKGFLP